MRIRNQIGWLWLALMFGLLTSTPVRAFYNPQTGLWLNRDPFKEKGGMNLYGFVANDPNDRIDLLGQNYYIIIEEGSCGVHHRVLIGDDGCGNCYTVEIYPEVKTWYQTYRRLCGKGVIDYIPHHGAAVDRTSGEGIIRIEKSVTTTTDQDKDMVSNAKSLDGKSITYCLGIQDCRSIELCTRTGKTVFENVEEQASQDISDVLSSGQPVGF